MALLPMTCAKPYVPPVKCQGIKTKLVPFILKSIAWSGEGRWIEPFLGSGVVLFNVRPSRALACDVNPHIVELYQQIADGELTVSSVREHLEREGEKLRQTGPDADESYYYEVRDRFNDSGDPLDFLFLNRSCFNGMVRFNQKGEFNVPFCRKPERFRPAYVTRITNQVGAVRDITDDRDWSFKCCDWRETLKRCRPDDFVYLDPPYIGRNTGYFNTEWSEDEARELAQFTRQLPCGFALSMWKKNKYRENDHIAEDWDWAVEKTQSHFYHLGSTEELRNSMTEALLISPGSEAN